MNARRTALSVILTVLAASSTLANGAEKAGRHPPRRLTGPDPSEFKIDKRLAAYLDDGNARRAKERIAKTSSPPLPAPTTAFSAHLDEKTVDVEVAGSRQGALVFAAAGQAIHVFNSQGEAHRTIRSGAEVQRLRWWKEHGLLLAGCLDQQVHAFSVDGELQWSFRSEDAIENPHGKALPARGPRRTQILVGCEDGGVLVLAIPSVGDRRSPTEWAGTPIQSARLTGSPTDIVTLETGDSIIAIFGADGGQVAGYRF